MASKLNPGADATLVGVAYRAAMANTPADYSDTLERAADSYAKTMEASSEMWSKIAKVGAKLGGEMVKNANERAAMAAKANTLNPEDAEFLIGEIYGNKDAQKELGFLPGVFGDRETKMDLAKLKMDQQKLFAEIDLAAASIKTGTDAVASGAFDTSLSMDGGEMVNAIIKSGLKNTVTDNQNVAKLGRNEFGELTYTLYKENGELTPNPNGTKEPVTMTIKQFNEAIATNVDDKGAKAAIFDTYNNQVAERGLKSRTGVYDEQMKAMDSNWLDTQIEKPVDLKRAMNMKFGYMKTSFFDDITKNQNQYSAELYADLLKATGGDALTGGIVDGIEDVGEPGINEVELKNSKNYQVLTANLLGMKDPEVTKAYFKDYVLKEFEGANNYGHSNKPPVPGGGTGGTDTGEHVGTSMPGVGWVPGEKKKEFRGYIDKFQDFQGNYGNWKFDKSEGKYYDSDAEEKAFISAYEVAQKEDAAKGDSADMFKYTVEDLEENKPLNMVGEPVEGGVYGNFFQKDDDDALPLLKKMFPSSFTFEETGMWGWGKGIEIFHPTEGSLGTYSFKRDAGSEADDQAKEFNSNMAQYFVGASGGTGAKYNKKKDNK